MVMVMVVMSLLVLSRSLLKNSRRLLEMVGKEEISGGLVVSSTVNPNTRVDGSFERRNVWVMQRQRRRQLQAARQ